MLPRWGKVWLFCFFNIGRSKTVTLKSHLQLNVCTSQNNYSLTLRKQICSCDYLKVITCSQKHLYMHIHMQGSNMQKHSGWFEVQLQLKLPLHSKVVAARTSAQTMTAESVTISYSNSFCCPQTLGFCLLSATCISRLFHWEVRQFSRMGMFLSSLSPRCFMGWLLHSRLLVYSFMGYLH